MSPDQYHQLTVNQINLLTGRRQEASTAFVAVNAAIVAVLSFVVKNLPSTSWAELGAALVLLLAGAVTCDLWRRLLSRYRELLAWWYQQLRTFEQSQPEEYRIFSREYAEIYHDEHTRARVGLSAYQIRLAGLFIGLYLTFAAITLVGIIRIWIA